MKTYYHDGVLYRGDFDALEMKVGDEWVSVDDEHLNPFTDLLELSGEEGSE